MWSSICVAAFLSLLLVAVCVAVFTMLVPLLSLPFVALVICGHRMLVVFVCSWYSYVHGPSGGVVMEP